MLAINFLMISFRLVLMLPCAILLPSLIKSSTWVKPFAVLLIFIFLVKHSSGQSFLSYHTCRWKTTVPGTFSASRTKGRQFDDLVNAIERKEFMSINVSVGWSVITASPLYSFFSSFVQQKIRDRRFSALVSQFSAMKKHGIVTKYSVPNKTFSVTIVYSTYTSHTKDVSKLCYITGMVFGTVQKRSVFSSSAMVISPIASTR